MTKLEQEIWNAQRKVASSSNPADHAKAAAEVAKKYIIRAIVDTHKNTINKTIPAVEFYDYWLKENGITEQPSIHQETGNDFKCFSLKAVPMCGFPQCGCKQD